MASATHCWLLQVSQGDGTIAVNFWSVYVLCECIADACMRARHDMSFDFKFVFYNFVKASKPVEPEAEHKELAAEEPVAPAEEPAANNGRQVF